MKVTSDSDGRITVSIPREEAEELIEALKLGSSSLLTYGLLGREARTLRAFAEGIRAALATEQKRRTSDPHRFRWGV